MKILLISMHKSHQDAVLEVTQQLGEAHEVVVRDEALENLERLATSERPNVIISGEVSDMQSYRGILEAFRQKHPNIALIMLCENAMAKSDFLMAAMHSGVEDVLSLPLQCEEFQLLLHRIEMRLAPTFAKSKGQVMAFVASKGGCGVTFLASNMAHVLAEEAKFNVALFDFDLHFGDAALIISDLNVVTTLTEIAKNMDRLDGALLKSSMLQVAPHFFVLPAPKDIGASWEVKPAQLETILKLAVSQYDYVFVDVGEPLGEISVNVLDLADTVIIVMEATLPFIRNCKRLVEAYLSLGIAKDKLRLLVNKYDKSGSISLQDIEVNLGITVFKTIPLNSETVALAINQGLPISQVARQDKVTQGLREAVQALAEIAPSKKSSWLKQWLHGPDQQE